MKKYVTLLLYILALYIVESLLYFLFYSAEHLIRYQSLDLQAALRDTLDVNGVRILFYGFIQVLFFMMLLVSFNPKRAWHIALINCGLYIFISCGMSAIFHTFGYFTAAFFFRLVAATLISPFILSLFRFRVTGMFTRINIPGEDYI